MPKQTLSQEIGSLGQSIVIKQISQSKFWIARNLTEDYGIDVELEFVNEFVTGKFIKAQIKSHESVLPRVNVIYQSLSKSFLRYASECRIPVLLIVVSTSNSKTWFVWLQKWIIDSGNVSNIYDESKLKNLKIAINEQYDFISGLEQQKGVSMLQICTLLVKVGKGSICSRFLPLFSILGGQYLPDCHAKTIKQS